MPSAARAPLLSWLKLICWPALAAATVSLPLVTVAVTPAMPGELGLERVERGVGGGVAGQADLDQRAGAEARGLVGDVDDEAAVGRRVGQARLGVVQGGGGVVDGVGRGDGGEALRAPGRRRGACSARRSGCWPGVSSWVTTPPIWPWTWSRPPISPELTVAVPLSLLKATDGVIVLPSLLCVEGQAAVVGADDQRLGADVDVHGAVGLGDGADVDELGELLDGGVALVEQGVGGAGGPPWAMAILPLSVAIWPARPSASFTSEASCWSGGVLDVGDLAAQVAEGLGDVLAVLDHHLPQAGVLRLVGQVRPAAEERAELGGEVVVAQGVDGRLDLPEVLLAGVGGAAVAGGGVEPALQARRRSGA